MAPNVYTDITTAEMERLVTQPNTALVDVRDEWEFDEFNIGGINIPLADIRNRKHELLGYDALIVICANGSRSRVAAKDICRQSEFQNAAVYHLHGGILEADE